MLSSLKFTKTARTIGNDPSTISKEIRKNTEIMLRKDSFSPAPCRYKVEYKVKGFCHMVCNVIYKICPEPGQKCIDLCDNKVPVQCLKLNKASYVCDECWKDLNYLLDKKYTLQNMQMNVTVNSYLFKKGDKQNT